MEPIQFIFAIAVLIMSVVAHEVSHGFVAERLGDPTARLAGRLTLNPIKHLDMVGSFIVPVLTFFMGGFIFGWAKPVPYNPHNLRGRYGSALVGVAGPVANIVIALIFSLLIRFSAVIGLSSAFIDIASIVVLLNILLAFFNLLPIPPLDGSKVLFDILPYKFNYIQQFLERYWMFAIFIFVFVLWDIFLPIIYTLFSLFTGI